MQFDVGDKVKHMDGSEGEIEETNGNSYLIRWPGLNNMTWYKKGEMEAYFSVLEKGGVIYGRKRMFS